MDKMVLPGDVILHLSIASNGSYKPSERTALSLNAFAWRT